jgi:hypothetical protein
VLHKTSSSTSSSILQHVHSAAVDIWPAALPPLQVAKLLLAAATTYNQVRSTPVSLLC